MTDKPDSNEIRKMAFAPGWEREHGVGHADYLDAVADGTYPANETPTDQVVPPDAGDGPGRNRTFLGFLPKDAPGSAIASYLQEAAGLVASWTGDEEGKRQALGQLWDSYFAGVGGEEVDQKAYRDDPPDVNRERRDR